MSNAQNTRTGERGGTTTSLPEAQQLIEQHKAQLTAAVRADILDHLHHHGVWHADDLRVDLTGHRNILGAVVIGLINRGIIRETGERRRSTAPASHGRKSNCYRLTQGGGDGRTQSKQRTSVGQPAVISPPGESGGSQLDEMAAAPSLPVEMTGGRNGAEHGGETVPAPTLFEMKPDPVPAPGHVDLDQRKAA